MRQEVDTIRQLVNRHDARARQFLILDRLALISDYVMRRQGTNLNEVRHLDSL